MEKFKDKRSLYIGIAIAAVVVVVAAVLGVISQFGTPISIQMVETSKVSSQSIKISWSDEYDSIVRKYVVKRRKVGENQDWEVVGSLKSDKQVDGKMNYIEDSLDSDKPQQFVYRVDMKLSNWISYKAQTGKERLSSNVLICLDAGHYEGRNTVEGELSYGYAEGDFTLDLALELRDILKGQYGIDVYMTRTTEHINIHGYRDINLDSTHIALRGMRAAYKDSDLFVSLHTNANADNAHGYETCMQPIGMNKPMVLVNTVGCDDPMTIAVSNSVGTNLAKANYALGTASVEEFITVQPGAVEKWTGEMNDMLDIPGVVCYRHKKDEATDYYGVLRGSAIVDRPGIIIEHGFHTVPEMRKEAMEGNLKSIWANIDAYGIAYGFGFETELEIQDLEIK